MPRIDAIFEAVHAQGASDLHIATGAPPMVRLLGDMHPVQYQDLTSELTQMLLHEIMGEREHEIFAKRRDVDFSYEVSGKFRVRCNIYEESRGLAGAFRLLPSSILTLEQLGLPETLAQLTELPRGLVVVTGPPGTGKSTTLAALIDHANNRQHRHIITIEDPIEYVHDNRNCLINQREVGKHTPDFASALRAALREDPDIILVGEMRDYETMSLALTAAQTGQLVLGTLHTPSAAETIERIIDVFPSEEQDQARGALANSFQGAIAQRLVRRADNRGRAVAVEILLASNAVSSLIRERKVHQIPTMMQTGRRDGMVMLEDSLRRLVQNGVTTLAEAQRCTKIKLAPPSRPSVPGASPRAQTEASGAVGQTEASGPAAAGRETGPFPASTRK